MEEMKEKYEAILQSWLEHNRKEKQEYKAKIQKQIDENAAIIHSLNEQISKLNEKRNESLKSKRPKEKVDAILELIQELEAIEAQPVLFRFTRAYVVRDQRNQVYAQIKNKMMDFDFDFEPYDTVFGKYMDTSSQTHKKIEELTSQLKAYLQKVEYTITSWDENRLSDLKKARNECLSKQKQLENLLDLYKPSQEYINFKAEYDVFMKEYESQDV